VKRDLPALASGELDLVVVGGGIHGAAAAWDAAQRGLSVALVERDDFGSGTSWNSLKTIHGGLRHLQRADIASLRESMRERRALLAVAPALVRPLPFFVPAYGHGLDGREALALALRVNDWLTLDRNRGLRESARIPDGRTVSARRALDMLPGLDGRGLTGAGIFCDAQASSTERLTLGFVHAAAERGAIVANHAEAVEVLRAGGRVVGVAVRDALTGATFEARARLVLNAAGPWANDLLRRAGLHRSPAPLLRARNLLLRRSLPFPYAVGARSGGRFLFLVPWQGTTLVGTDYQPAEDRPRDAGEFLAEADRAFPWVGLAASKVALVHEGLVPGRGGAEGLATRPHLHDHEAEDGLGGLVSVQGVKLTTARAVAERAVDVVFRRLGRASPRCRTAVTPLPRARPLEGGLEERARRAVWEEMALGLSDAVLRRLDLGTAGPPSERDLDAVCGVLREELGWDEERERGERAALQTTYPPP
jgi:glycerol-3-phosphate dehydrogenase